ncbi:MAG: hypothetical protein C1O27_001654 [Chloroflexi bacterium]|jgi:hypothetical protein|nr:MAG: hypothetical protein C1O27_001654 [Chloroflexota bacterium]
MADIELLDRTYHFITRSFVETGRAPHFTEVARELALPVEEGRQAVHDLAASGIPMWLHPGTDTIVSIAPFSSLPTHYRITIGRQKRWYGQ